MEEMEAEEEAKEAAAEAAAAVELKAHMREWEAAERATEQQHQRGGFVGFNHLNTAPGLTVSDPMASTTSDWDAGSPPFGGFNLFGFGAKKSGAFAAGGEKAKMRRHAGQ